MSRTAFISSTTPSSANSSKTKYKQVEFNEQVVKSKAPTKRRLRNRVHEREAGVKVSEEGSDLADIDEVEGSLNGGSICDSRSQPSPRRLRSKEKTCDQGKEKTLDVRSQRMETRSQRKVSGSREKRVSRTPPSKRGVGGSESGQVQRKEEDSLEEDGVEANVSGGKEDERGGESESEEDEEEAGQEEEDGQEDGDGVEDDGNEEEGEEGGIDTSIIQGKDEADELVSSTSTTSLIPRSSRTPLRKRSRIRNGDTTPDDGDVEDEGEGEMADSEEREVVDEIQGNGEESANVDEDVAAGSENEAAISQTLKTCGVVDEDVEMETVEEDIGEEDSETSEEEGDTDSELDVDVEGETDEDEVMDEEGAYVFGASSLHMSQHPFQLTSLWLLPRLLFVSAVVTSYAFARRGILNPWARSINLLKHCWTGGTARPMSVPPLHPQAPLDPLHPQEDLGARLLQA